MMRIRKNSSGFTLIELLVVVAIIALLMGILIPSLASARTQAKQVRAQSDLRQIVGGYIIYQQENDGRLLLGYPPADLLNGFYEPNLNRTFTGPHANIIAMRYAWRMVPHLQHIWSILHSHEPMPPLPDGDDTDTEILNKAYDLSLYPTYGLNSIYFGGDISGSGFNSVGALYYPNTGKHIVFKTNEVTRPGELIVFGQVRNYNVSDPKTSGAVGHFRLTPPRASGVQWHWNGEKLVADVMAPACGVPQGWYKNEVAVAYFDGHVESVKPQALTDMRMWANNAEKPDYDYTP